MTANRHLPTTTARTRLAIAIALGLALAAGQCVQARAQTQQQAEKSAPDLVELNLAELMQVEVTSASRKAQKLSDVASAAYVISSDDIRRSGARNLPEALRLAPGVDVGALGANRYAVSIRGFNGRFANKLLVLIDGRTVYTPLWSGVLWESQDVALDDIERIEVIRGPGAVVWGANAVNGVINIITRAAGETQGTRLHAEAGSGDLLGFAARHGAKAGPAAWRVYARADRRGEYRDTTGQGAADDSRSARAGARYESDDGPARFMLQAEAFRLDAGDRLTLATVIAPYSMTRVERETDRGFHVLGRWTRGLPGAAAVTLQSYLDYSEIAVPLLTYARRTTFDLDLNFHLVPAAAHDLIAGLAYRASRDATRDEQLIRFEPRARLLSIASAFVQDEITVVPDKLKLTAGAKLERHTYTGSHLSPNLRLLWNAAPAATLWAAASKAVRTPSRGERDALFAWDVVPPDPRLPGLAGRLATQTIITATHNAGAERLIALEAGYRGKPLDHIAFDLSIFDNHYKGLIKRAPDLASARLVPGPPPHIEVPIFLSNKLALRTHGFEAALDYRPCDWWRLQGAYSTIKLKLDRSTDLENIDGSTPRYLASLRSTLDLGPAQLDLWVRRVGERPMYYSPLLRVPAYSAVDLRTAWRIRRGWDAAFTVQNLFDRRYQQFYPDKVTSRPLRAERTFHLQLNHTY
ncbi:MAG TPA: TonB-dependent receptor [Burkholderiaceae bacterium]